jgi:hypothetical protein
MTKRNVLKTKNQGTALATGTLALTPLVMEGLEDFKGSFDRLCLQAGTGAIEAMLAADAEQFCGKRYERHGDRRAYRWGLIGSEIGWHGGNADRCGDAQVRALGTAAGRRSGRAGQARHDEVLGVAAVCGAEHGEAEGMAGD